VAYNWTVEDIIEEQEGAANGEDVPLNVVS
jgi:hypothetical protein